MPEKNIYKNFDKDALFSMMSETEKLADVGGWLWDITQDLWAFSDNWLRIHGCTKRHLSTSELLQIAHPDDIADVQEAFDAAINNGANYEIEHRIVQQDTGEVRYVRVCGRSQMGGNGKVVKIYGFAQDITERKKSEKILCESQEKFRHLFDHSPIGKTITYISGEMQSNTAFAEMLGYSQEEFRHFKWQDITHPDDIDLSQNILESVISCEKESDRFTKRYIHKNGSTVWADVNTRLQRDSDCTPLYFITAVIDITDRKRSEEELQKSEERYRQLIENINDVIYSTDENGNLTFVSPVVRKIMGYDPTEFIGKSFTEFVHEDDLEYLAQRYSKVISGDLEPGEYRLLTKSGATLWIRSSSRPVYEGNRFIGLRGVFSDISESKKLEGQLRQSQKMESIGNLAGGIAHDFNNILSSIIGFTELGIDEVQKGTQLEDSLQEVYSAGKRAKELVKQILAFARQSDEKKSPINPGFIASEVVNFIRSTIPTTIEIRQHIESKSLIIGNSTQVHQVLMNLCTNAAHAMEASGGVLKLRLNDVILDNEDLLIGMRPGGYVKIEVSDTGVGIAPEVIGSIFDPYFTTKSSGEGSGMGLAVAHGIIESYGGRITVESQVRKGTKFTIYLPATKKRSGQDVYVSEQLPSGTERILFVDDEVPIAKMGVQILERLGYSVTPRTSSVEALELFQAKPNEFDLVITDMTMPNMTGDKMAIELMKIRPDIPIILCTGYSKKISDDPAFDIGIKAFAYKPIVKADLAKTVRKVLDQAKS